MILYILSPYYPFENAVFVHGTPRRCPAELSQRLKPPLSVGCHRAVADVAG